MVPLPPETLKEAGFQEGMEIQITSSLGRVEMEPVGGPTSEVVEFAARFTKRYQKALAALAES